MILATEVNLNVVDVNYRISPLTRGEMEIPVEVIVKVDYHCKNKELSCLKVY